MAYAIVARFKAEPFRFRQQHPVDQYVQNPLSPDLPPSSSANRVLNTSEPGCALRSQRSSLRPPGRKPQSC